MTKKRCHWVGKGKDFYDKYHDSEWGVPVHDDRKHFEFLILEGAQAGLSWETILKRREGYRKVFKNFNPSKVAYMTNGELEKLLKNPSIIRNRLKIFSAQKNARVFLEIQKEYGSFDKYVWEFVGGRPIINAHKKPSDIPTTSKESNALSNDLKKRGMSFVGSIIIYAYMQATGLINDHLTECFRYNICKKMR